MSLAHRMGSVHRSFIREILKVTADPEIISFAGGLPSPESFPTAAFSVAAKACLDEEGARALQYSTTEGDPELRSFISNRLQKTRGICVVPDEILVTTGSQQALDLLAKALLDAGDTVLLERPGYLGAIQSFSLFETQFVTVDLEDDGPDLAALEQILETRRVKLFYTVPNFQNPSGITHSLEKRKKVGALLSRYDVVLVEDDPYGDLRYKGDPLPPLRSFFTGTAVTLGSFSKITAPGLRLGYMATTGEVLNACITAKQASDLHTPTFTQRVLVRYLRDNDLDTHIETIRSLYGPRRDLMVSCIKQYFPKDVCVTEPDGGMFLWATLPAPLSCLDLLEKAIENKVAFVPGTPFYVDGGGKSTLRLNFSNADPERIETGIKRLANGINAAL